MLNKTIVQIVACISFGFAAISGLQVRAECVPIPNLFVNGSQCIDTNSYASMGRGGAFPGNQVRTFILGSNNKSYFLFIPTQYDPGRALPLFVALHGSPGNVSLVDASASAVRDHWARLAETNQFIVIAPKASGTSGGGWVPGQSADYANIAAAILDTTRAYNIDRNRIYLWGYSAGGHVAHDLALWEAGWLQLQNIRFAAYGVNAGVLRAVAGNSGPVASVRKISFYSQIGLNDSLLADARNDRAIFLANGWNEGDNFRYSEFAGGHVYVGADSQGMWEFLAQYRAFTPIILAEKYW